VKRFVDVKPKNKNQEKLINSILTNVLTFIIGESGCGKTYVTCGMAAKLLNEDRISQIVLTRPQIEVGNQTCGFLPGTYREKLLPYITPMLDALGDFLGHSYVDKLIKEEIIQILPIGLIRGHSIKNSFIMADEGQSLSYLELKTLLTRIDVGSRLVIASDTKQCDLNNNAKDLKEVLKKLADLRDEIGLIHFTIEDCCRAGIVKKILERL